MSDQDIEHAQLFLCMCWLRHDEAKIPTTCSKDMLRQFACDMDVQLSDEAFNAAAAQLDSPWANGDIDMWITSISFLGHPHLLWNVMLGSVQLAKKDEHLKKIATSLAEPILAHYGSMVTDFEEFAIANEAFARMLTGAWRHRMSDDVWQRLRILQARVTNPLKTMIPIELGADYMADGLSLKNRQTADKGMYARDTNGVWKKAVSGT